MLNFFATRFGLVVFVNDLQSLIEEGADFEMLSNGVPIKIEVSEDFFVGREFDGGTGSSERTKLFQVGSRLSFPVGLLPFMSITTNGCHEFAG